MCDNIKNIYKTEWEPNGDIFTGVDYYLCFGCGALIPDSWPTWTDKNSIVFCTDCAFRLGIMSELEFVKSCYWFSSKSSKTKVGINPDNGRIVLTEADKFSWERNSRDTRKDPRYKKWRSAVFNRDNYICNHCGKRGGDLEAHHIKAYAKFKKERFNLNNGVTLCKKCHCNLHKKSEGDNEIPS